MRWSKCASPTCFAISLAAGLTWAGCGRPSFETAPVHGTVTIDGAPVPRGKVMFAPVAKGDLNPGRPGWGEIGPAGEYRLSTFQQEDGAVVGEHWVTILNAKDKLPQNVPEFDRFMMPKRVTVTAGIDNRIDLQLTSKMIQEFGEDDR